MRYDGQNESSTRVQIGADDIRKLKQSREWIVSETFENLCVKMSKDGQAWDTVTFGTYL